MFQLKKEPKGIPKTLGKDGNDAVAPVNHGTDEHSGLRGGRTLAGGGTFQMI